MNRATPRPLRPRAGYDWRACFIAIVGGLSLAGTLALLVAQVTDSPLYITAVVTVIGPLVSQWIYRRVARPGARPMDSDQCNDDCVI